MEIIFELFVAFVVAVAEVVSALLRGVASLLSAVFECIFLFLTQGKSAATEQFQKRKQEREERMEQQNKLHEEKRIKRTGAVKTTSASQVADDTPSITPSQYAILGSLVFIIIIGLIVTWVVLDRIQQQRIAETRSQVNQLADKYALQISDREIADPLSGRLHNRDAWKQQIDLSVDKAWLGSLVVVRSSGPDRQPGSIDDIIAIRAVRATVKEVGGKLAKRSIKSVRDRIAGWLPSGDKEEQPEETDRVEE